MYSACKTLGVQSSTQEPRQCAALDSGPLAWTLVIKDPALAAHADAPVAQVLALAARAEASGAFGAGSGAGGARGNAIGAGADASGAGSVGASVAGDGANGAGTALVVRAEAPSRISSGTDSVASGTCGSAIGAGDGASGADGGANGAGSGASSASVGTGGADGDAGGTRGGAGGNGVTMWSQQQGAAATAAHSSPTNGPKVFGSGHHRAGEELCGTQQRPATKAITGGAWWAALLRGDLSGAAVMKQSLCHGIVSEPNSSFEFGVTYRAPSNVLPMPTLSIVLHSAGDAADDVMLTMLKPLLQACSSAQPSQLEEVDVQQRLDSDKQQHQTENGPVWAMRHASLFSGIGVRGRGLRNFKFNLATCFYWDRIGGGHQIVAGVRTFLRTRGTGVVAASAGDSKFNVEVYQDCRRCGLCRAPTTGATTVFVRASLPSVRWRHSATSWRVNRRF
ncbi:hypothetical protein JKP88DRAFT_254318 [Tribonema minus]|uniref:Uncharacterized protein n=1 Tax=Tribonema minus TaxID=303371 RepID=A0A835ZD60_9STRA|nr:hypothetical protein JKP88DRAFT_254318 [Tribonema minus]